MFFDFFKAELYHVVPASNDIQKRIWWLSLVVYIHAFLQAKWYFHQADFLSKASMDAAIVSVKSCLKIELWFEHFVILWEI